MCEHYGHGQPLFQRLLRRGSYKYVAHLDEIEELYDLARDPFELKNLARDPDARTTDALRDMRDRLLRWMDAHGDRGPKAQELRAQIAPQ